MFILLLSFVVMVVHVAFAGQNEAATSSAKSSLGDLKSIEMMIQSERYHGIQLGQLYFQLGFHLHHSWINKVKTGHQNLLLEASNAFGEALKLIPMAPETVPLIIETLSLRGLSLKMLGRGSEAIECYDFALSFPLVDVDLALLHHSRGDAFLMLSDLSSAIRDYDASFSLAPCKTDRYHGYVTTLKALKSMTIGDWRNLTQRLLSVEADCRDNQSKINSRETTNQQSDDRDEVAGERLSSNVVERYTDLATDFEDEFAEEALALYQDEDEDDVEEMTNSSRNPLHSTIDQFPPATRSYMFQDVHDGNRPTKQADLFYAIYMAADQAGFREIAWKYLELANQAEYSHRNSPFDREQAIHMKNTTVQIFTEDFLDSFPSLSDYPEILNEFYEQYPGVVATQTDLVPETSSAHSVPTKKGKRFKQQRRRDQPKLQPIFIVGMMRSGSTLLETMLDTHPNIWGMGEDSVFNSNLTSLRDALARSSFSDSPNRKDQMSSIANILAEYHVLTLHEMHRVAVSVTSTDPKSYQKTSAVVAATGSSPILSSADALSHRTSSNNSTNNSKYQKDLSQLRYIVDKMLFNYRNLGFINLVYPEAPILHLVRDPLDTLYSCYRLKFDDVGLHWTLTPEDLVLQYVLYLETVAHFRRVLPPNRILDIRYEELVHQPESTLRRLFTQKLPELAFDADQLLRFHENARAVHTHSQTQVKQKLYGHAIGQWRRYASQLQPFIDAFRVHLPRLRRMKALPFAKEINWEMRIDFPYDKLGSSVESR